MQIPISGQSPKSAEIADEAFTEERKYSICKPGPSSFSPMECLICGSLAKRNHYGFFRRTVANKKTYYCSKKNCDLMAAKNTDEGLKRLCKFCRFNKCVQKGMVIDSIFRRKFLAEEDQFRDCSLLERIIRARQATFINKINILGKIARENNCNPRMGMLKPDAEQTIMSKMSEFEVLMIFLKDSGLGEMGLSELDMARIACRTYYRWLFVTAAAITLRSGGHQSNTVYFSDRGHVPVRYDDCFDFFKTHGVNNLHVIAKAWYELFILGMRVGQQFHQAHLDRTEFALLSQLLILTEGRELFPSITGISQRIDDLFQEMKKYHEENYSDVALRLGNLILLLNNINEMQEHISHMAIIMQMSGYPIVLPKIMENYGLTNL